METKPLILAPVTLDGARLRLRPLTLDDVTDRYVAWLNDREVQRYSEYQFVRHTITSVQAYVARMAGDPQSYFFAITIRSTGEHIGNVKLGPIDVHHRRGSIGIVIGEPRHWGRGYATEAIALLERFAFDTLHLHKLTAGMYATNVGSRRIFEKLGFTSEGCRTAHCWAGNEWIDYLEFGKVCAGHR